MVPPSISQSMSITERRAASDQAKLVAHDVEVCPERVVQTPRSNVTVLSRFPRAPRTHSHRGYVSRHRR